MEPKRRITALSAVADDSTYLFRVADGEPREAILGRADGDVSCWLNYCQQFTHITLDTGSGGAMRNRELVCEVHGAYLEADSGLWTFGPCEGAPSARST